METATGLPERHRGEFHRGQLAQQQLPPGPERRPCLHQRARCEDQHYAVLLRLGAAGVWVSLHDRGEPFAASLKLDSSHMDLYVLAIFCGSWRGGEGGGTANPSVCNCMDKSAPSCRPAIGEGCG